MKTSNYLKDLIDSKKLLNNMVVSRGATEEENPKFDSLVDDISANVNPKFNFKFSYCPGDNFDFNGFDTSHITDMTEWFRSCTDLTSLDVSMIDTSNVTSMNSMFEDCRNLISADISGFDFTNVTTATKLFYSCSKLTDIIFPSTVGSSKISSVTMAFSGCSALTNVDLKALVLSSCTNYDSLFKSCSKLTSFDLTGADISGDLSSMFYGCSLLPEIDLSNNTSSSTVTQMDYAFYYCSKATKIKMPNIITSGLTKLSNAFSNCPLLEEVILPTSIDLSKVTDFGSVYYNDNSLVNTGLDNFYMPNCTTIYRAFYNCKALEDVSFLSVNTDLSKVTNMTETFRECGKIKNIDLSKAAMNISSFSYAFTKCSSLVNLDLSLMNTDKLAGSLQETFYECSNLETFALNNPLNLTNITNLYRTFYGCNKLNGLDMSLFNTAKCTNLGMMFCDCHNLEFNLPSTFSFEKSTNNLSVFKNCYKLTDLSNVELNLAASLNMMEMFYGCSALTNIKPSTVACTKTTGSSWAFYGCESLASLDLSNFDFSNCINLSNMFENCYSLETLLLPTNFGTNTQVTSFNNVFSNCCSLKELDLSGMCLTRYNYEYMFNNCRNLETIGLTDMNITFSSTSPKFDKMFYDCQKLALNSVTFNLDCSGTYGIDFSDVFYNCQNIKKISLLRTSASYPNKDYKFNRTFYNNKSLEEVVITAPRFSYMSECNSTFYGCEKLKNLTFVDNRDNYKLGYAYDNNYMFAYCSSLEDINGLFASGTNYSSGTNGTITHKGMFLGCSSLTEIDLTDYAAKICSSSDVSSMFSGCTNLTKIVMNYVASSNAYWISRNLSQMFYNCTNLKEVTLPSNLVNGATSTGENEYMNCFQMFAFCENLETISLPYFMSSVTEGGTAAPTKLVTSYMFEGCSALKEIILNGMKTKALEDGTGMFDGCTSLQKLDIRSQDIGVFAATENAYKIFEGIPYDCTIYVKNIDEADKLLAIANIKQFTKVTPVLFNFTGNTKPVIDMGKYNTSELTTLNSKFRDHTEITSISFKGCDVSNITDIGFAFNGCTNLTFLDIRPFVLNDITSKNFFLQNINTNCLIVVGSDDDKAFIEANYPNLHNLYNETEYEDAVAAGEL